MMIMDGIQMLITIYVQGINMFNFVPMNFVQNISFIFTFNDTLILA
jgi:hypothetical protein